MYVIRQFTGALGLWLCISLVGAQTPPPAELPSPPFEEESADDETLRAAARQRLELATQRCQVLDMQRRQSCLGEAQQAYEEEMQRIDEDEESAPVRIIMP